MIGAVHRGTRRRLRFIFTLILLPALALAVGCDRTPGGEGHWEVSIEGPGAPFGAAVVMISGDGVMGITGAAGTQVWSREGSEGEFRAVIIQPESSGNADFRIRVKELREQAPSVTILQLADMQDEAVSVTSSHNLRFRR